MTLKTVKRMASDILGVGISRIKIRDVSKVKTALTKDDVRGLIKQGLIYVEKATGISRRRAKERHEKKKTGQKRGFGSRKGKKGARIKEKEQWINKTRKQRKILSVLKPKLISGKKKAVVKGKG